MDRWNPAIVELLARAILGQTSMTPTSSRYVVGIAGGPASGKSSLADQLMRTINVMRGRKVAKVLPLDGFHIRNAELNRLGWSHLKGAPQTFEVEKFIKFLMGVRSGAIESAPAYDRNLHDVVDN